MKDNGIAFEEPGIPMMMNTATATPISIVRNVRLKTKTTKGFCNETDVFFLVASNVQEAVLIAWHDLIELGVIGADFPVANRPTADNMATCRTMRARASLHSIMEEYSDVVSDKLKSEPMRGPPMKIVLKEGAIPRRVNIARQVPLRFREEFQKVISDLEDKKIIEKLGDSEPTEWCSHGFAVPKTPPKVRLFTDYQPLNKWVERPIHPFPAVKDIIRCIPASAKVFAKMDAVHGYFQLTKRAPSSRRFSWKPGDCRPPQTSGARGPTSSSSASATPRRSSTTSSSGRTQTRSSGPASGQSWTDVATGT